VPESPFNQGLQAGDALVGDEDATASYMEQLRPWVAGSMDLVVRIRCEVAGAASSPSSPTCTRVKCG
jgi:hypothetical protein